MSELVDNADCQEGNNGSKHAFPRVKLEDGCCICLACGSILNTIEADEFVLEQGDD